VLGVGSGLPGVISIGVSCETPYPGSVDEVAIDWSFLVLQAEFTYVAVREAVGVLDEIYPAALVHTYASPFETLTVSNTILQ